MSTTSHRNGSGTALDALFQERNRKLAVLEGQYGQVARAINDFFEAVEAVQPGDWKTDGIGSCGASPHTFDDHMVGELATVLPARWAMLAGEAVAAGRVLGDCACPYHERGKGCILGDIKPAQCLTYVDYTQVDFLDEHAPYAEDVFRRTLRHVMLATFDPDTGDMDPARNEKFVRDALTHIERLTWNIQSLDIK